MTLAFVFPGQGSQSVGMLHELAQAHTQVRDTFAEAAAALGFDLWSIVSNGPEERLNQTEITQPAMLSAGVATWRVWRAQGGAMPATMAGHSLGEYTALVCAGALDFTDAVRLVADRARYMQEAVPVGQGGMAAVLGLEDDAVRALCVQAAEGDVLEAVNFNSPGQIVIAGTAAAIARAVVLAKEAGAKRALALPVSVPSHCALMAPAAARMAERFKSVNLRVPTVPVVHNVSARAEADVNAIRDALTRQIAAPVRWVETVEQITNNGARTFIECGPGKVLTGLNKRIRRELDCRAVYDSQSLQDTLAALQ
ncbi:MAG: ACP S-malonyltransferase [Gammaproteobacteria bacterium]|nr:ACP S-malonyltransferase [Gammaproteobacteria bacterium]